VTDEAIATDVADMPGKADVVAVTVNVIEAVEAEAVVKADDTKDKAKATDANDADKAVATRG
jgi:hypothetical protein